MGTLDLNKAYPGAVCLVGENDRSASSETKVVHANGKSKDVGKLLPLTESDDYQPPVTGENFSPISGVDAMIQADIASTEGWQNAARETKGVFDVLRGKKVDSDESPTATNDEIIQAKSEFRQHLETRTSIKRS